MRFVSCERIITVLNKLVKIIVITFNSVIATNLQSSTSAIIKARFIIQHGGDE